MIFTETLRCGHDVSTSGEEKDERFKRWWLRTKRLCMVCNPQAEPPGPEVLKKLPVRHRQPKPPPPAPGPLRCTICGRPSYTEYHLCCAVTPGPCLSCISSAVSQRHLQPKRPKRKRPDGS